MTLPAAVARGHEPSAGPYRHRDPKDGLWHVHIAQGDAYVAADSAEVLTTILGSCVATCMRDPVAGIGGMNHFLLPEGSGLDRLALRYGVNAMEVLINGILSQGGMRQRLEAKLFGGANVMNGLGDIGARNIAFARKFLGEEGISLVGGHLGGTAARRIQYWPQSGRARQMVVTALDTGLMASELSRAQQQVVSSSQRENDLELF